MIHVLLVVLRKKFKMSTNCYVLTGFSSELDKRPISFKDKISSCRTCTACGIMPSKLLVLQICGHVYCGHCYLSISELKKCPEDSEPLDIDFVSEDRTSAEDLLKYQVFCWNRVNGCDHTCTLSELPDHFVVCRYFKMDCRFCNKAVIQAHMRDHIVSRCREKSEEGPEVQSTEDFVKDVELVMRNVLDRAFDLGVEKATAEFKKHVEELASTEVEAVEDYRSLSDEALDEPDCSVFDTAKTVQTLDLMSHKLESVIKESVGEIEKKVTLLTKLQKSHPGECPAAENSPTASKDTELLCRHLEAAIRREVMVARQEVRRLTTGSGKPYTDEFLWVIKPFQSILASSDKNPLKSEPFLLCGGYRTLLYGYKSVDYFNVGIEFLPATAEDEATTWPFNKAFSIRLLNRDPFKNKLQTYNQDSEDLRDQILIDKPLESVSKPPPAPLFFVPLELICDYTNGFTMNSYLKVYFSLDRP